MNYREDLIKVSELYFRAQIEKHKVNVEIMLENTVGVGEHPNITETVEQELDIIAGYEDKLSVLKKYFTDSKSKKKRVING